MNTPIIDFVREYKKREGTRFHMPGHKGHVFFGWEPFDITEIPGADVLHQGRGIIWESEENAAVLFGTGQTFYTTEGSSHCIKAMLAALCMERGVWDRKGEDEGRERKGWENEGRRPWLLAARNVHRSMVDACALLDLDVEFLWGESSESLCSHVISAEQLEEALGRHGERPLAVYVTSPDYLGQMADIPALSRICHREGIPLVVDNAHGAYLHFLEERCHPMDLGAAMCCDSAHKTLPALTGAAYLHVHPEHGQRFLPYARQAMLLFGSTSPSYLTLQSLDYCNAYLAADYEKRLEEILERAEEWKRMFGEAGGKVLPSEPLKIVLDTAGLGYQGDEIGAELREYDIECEYEDQAFVVLMVTPENTGRDWARLHEWGKNTRMLRQPRKGIPRAIPERLRSKRVMSIRQAAFAKSEVIPVSRAVGRVCAVQTVSCPPAVPIAICGEEITQAMVGEFKKFGIKEVSVVL